MNETAETLLGPDDPVPVLRHGMDRTSPFLVLCDHAGNAIPSRLGDLGLSEEQRSAHIAWDIRGWEHAVALADRLGAPLIGQAYSRLVIDCNRRQDAADSIAESSDGIAVPGNLGLSSHHRTARWQEVMLPYQNAIATSAASQSCLIAMHTCTSRLRGGPMRPWHVGVIADTDRRMQRGILNALSAANIEVGDNEPYRINPLTDYTLPVHAEAAGRPYVEFEMRNDLFATAEERTAIADRLAQAIEIAYADLGREATL